MATLIAICTWDSQRSDTEAPRQQKLYWNAENNLTQRNYNENNSGWHEVGIIHQPYSEKHRACFFDKELPNEIKNDVRNNVIIHGTIWRL